MTFHAFGDGRNVGRRKLVACSCIESDAPSGRCVVRNTLVRLAGWVFVVAAAAPAEASPLAPALNSDAVKPQSAPPVLVLFAGTELDAANSYGSAGFKARPFRPLGVDRFVVAGALGGGSWRETNALALKRESDSRKFSAYLLGGAELAVAGGSLGLFAGPDYFQETATDPRGITLRRERRFGVRVHVDWWSHPTPGTLLTLNIAAGSAKRDIWSRAAFGWSLGEPGSIWGFAGPEVSLYAARDSTKARIGIHWSELGRAGFKFRISAGLLKETGHRAGPYLSIGGYYGF